MGFGAHGRSFTPALSPTVTATPSRPAIEDLREGLLGLLEEFGAPKELTLTVPDAA